MNIGIVDYLNAWPYRKSLEFLRDAKMPAFESLKIFPDIPSKLASRLLEGKLDLALISSIEYWRHREQLQFLPTFCIAAHAEVQSIRLITSKDNAERSFEEALALIDTIYCDIATRSSQAMLLYLYTTLGLKLPRIQIIDPVQYMPESRGLTDYEGFLTIGDIALNKRYEPSFDLGSEYNTITERSFVYALWCFPSTTNESKRQALNALLRLALERSDSDSEIFTTAAEKYPYPVEFIQFYLQELIVYELNDDLIHDMNVFFENAPEPPVELPFGS